MGKGARKDEHLERQAGVCLLIRGRTAGYLKKKPAASNNAKASPKETLRHRTEITRTKCGCSPAPRLTRFQRLQPESTLEAGGWLPREM